jgi:HK97 family phage major capsid protein
MDMLKKLAEEREGATTFINKLTDGALSESRDMTDNELELIKRSQVRISEIDKQINVLSTETELDEQAKERLARHTRGVHEPAGSKGLITYNSAGQFLQDYVASHVGDQERKAEASDRLKRYYRAAAHITTGQFTGVFPNEVVGPVIDLVNTTRPLVSALGTIPVPGGPSFRRPRLNDPNIATGVGVQANQKDELVSQQFTISSDNVDLSTLGGYVNVARQVIDWGVASMDTIVNQLAKRYSYATERAALVELEKSTGKVTLALTATAAETVAAIFDAAALLFETTGELPTHLVVGPKGWARLGGLTDAAGRQIFPFMAPANAAGTMAADSMQGNPVGLILVVTPAITDEDMWVVNGASLEIYEQVVGQLSVIEPSVLGVQISYSGYTGYYRPTANGAVLLAP